MPYSEWKDDRGRPLVTDAREHTSAQVRKNILVLFNNCCNARLNIPLQVVYRVIGGDGKE